MPREKSRAHLLPDEIDSDTILISKHGAIFTVDRVSNRVVPLPKADNTRVHLLKERAPKEERAKVRLKSGTKRVPQYGIVHYWRGRRMGGGTLFMTIEELRKQEVKILRHANSKRFIKYTLASKSLEELTSTREYNA